MSSNDDQVKEIGNAPDMTVDEFLRTLVGQCFENDNDTTYLNATLKATDGSESQLEFKIRIQSINGTPTREEED